jgi:hypothetical protein
MKRLFTALIAIVAAFGLATSAFAQAPAKKAPAEKISVATEMPVIALNAKMGYAQVKEGKRPTMTAVGASCKLHSGSTITLVGVGDKPDTFRFRSDAAGGTGYCPKGTEFILGAKVADDLRTASAGAPAKK